jgi:hypothetical protein
LQASVSRVPVIDTSVPVESELLKYAEWKESIDDLRECCLTGDGVEFPFSWFDLSSWIALLIETSSFVSRDIVISTALEFMSVFWRSSTFE